MVATAPTVAPHARAAPPRSMVPSLSFLPRWWVIGQVLLGVAASLVVIGWLAVIASRGGRPVPASGAGAAGLHLAGRSRCPAGLPRTGCPAAALLLLGLHDHCKATDTFLYEFHRAYLFTPTMCTRRPPGLPPGPHIATSIQASFGISRRVPPPDEDRAWALDEAGTAAGDVGRGRDSPRQQPGRPPAPEPAEQRDEVRDIWDNLFVEDDAQPRARHTHVHHHHYDHFDHVHRHPNDEQAQNAEAEHLVTAGRGRGQVPGHGHVGPDTAHRAHDHADQAQRQRRGGRAPDTTTTMVCYLFITLLVASAILAIGEVIRDWWTHLAAKSRRG